MIVEFIKRAFGVARVAKENVNAVSSAQDAYDSGAALPGVVLAFSGATSAKADDLAMAAVLEVLDGAQATVSQAAATAEMASQTAASVAFELRSLERFIARLRGAESLKAILEDDGIPG